MSLEGETVCRSSRRRQQAVTIAIWMLAITTLCAVMGWASTEGLAQEAMLAVPRMAAQSRGLSVERPKSNGVPHLVIGMIDREGGAANALARSGIAPAASLVPSVTCLEKRESEPLLVSDLLKPDPGVHALAHYHCEGTLQRWTNQPQPLKASTDIYSLLNDGSAEGWFLYGDQTDRSRANLKIAVSESSWLEAGTSPQPLLLVEVGRWQLPVVLSSAALER